MAMKLITHIDEFGSVTGIDADVGLQYVHKIFWQILECWCAVIAEHLFNNHYHHPTMREMQWTCTYSVPAK